MKTYYGLILILWLTTSCAKKENNTQNPAVWKPAGTWSVTCGPGVSPPTWQFDLTLNDNFTGTAEISSTPHSVIWKIQNDSLKMTLTGSGGGYIIKMDGAGNDQSVSGSYIGSPYSGNFSMTKK